jgi:hypothetical protein
LGYPADMVAAMLESAALRPGAGPELQSENIVKHVTALGAGIIHDHAS